MTRRLSPIYAALTALAVGLPLPAIAEADAGAYLAARLAGYENDFKYSARYFEETLKGDPNNPGLIESAMVSYMGLGEFDAAAPLAAQLADMGVPSTTAHLVNAVSASQDEDWAAIFAQLEAGQSISPLVDGLIQSWAFLGQGRMGHAIDSFDEVIDGEGLRAFGLYHKALALAAVGDFEGAEAIFNPAPGQGLQRTRRAALAHAQVLSQLSRNADAVAMLDASFGPDPDPGVASLRFRLNAGEPVPFDFVNGAKDGVAEILFSLASALEGDADDSYILLYARAATVLRPDHTQAHILTGRMLDQLGRYDLSNEAYARVSQDDPSFYAAELGRADALRSAGNMGAAIEVLSALSRSHATSPFVLASLGDALRQNGQMREANEAYTKAIDLYDDGDPAKWFVLYTRGITFERLDAWEPAEADFRAALVLNPGHPSVLNYLGYSLVEKQIKLDEALAMIQQAAAAQPDSGAIIDSLGWVLYRLGKYPEAIPHMERAAELEPVDPIINDHLGDVFWAVGRKIEARFQWNRALSFDPTEEDADRIRRKLDVGLDQVLSEEGAPPLQAGDTDDN